MTDQKWLEEYTGQSTDQLIALEGGYRTDSLVLAFEQAVDQKAAKIGMDKLSESERVILAIEALEREVNNGGYSQLFYNSSKKYAPIMASALKAIGCSKTEGITKKAIDILNISGRLTVDAIDKVMN